MLASVTARRWLNKAARQYLYGAGAGALFAAVTIKLFWFTAADQVTALSGPYSALISVVALFIGAIIGIQRISPQPPQSFGGADARDKS